MVISDRQAKYGKAPNRSTISKTSSLLKKKLTHRIRKRSTTNYLIRRNLVLAGHQPVNSPLVLQEDPHPDERLPPFLRQHVPRLGPCQQVGDAALGQTQHCLPEKTLADGVLGQDFFDPTNCVVSVDVAVPVKLLLRYWR